MVDGAVTVGLRGFVGNSWGAILDTAVLVDSISLAISTQLSTGYHATLMSCGGLQSHEHLMRFSSWIWLLLPRPTKSDHQTRDTLGLLSFSLVQRKIAG